MHRGYVKLYRCIQDNEIYHKEPFTMGHAWMDLLMLASYKEKSVIIKKQTISLKIGQLCWSEVSLAKRWHWGRTKLRSFLKLLETEHQIEQQKNNLTTLITIINYETYQQTEQQTEQQPNSNRTATEQQPNTNKKDKNINKDKKDKKKDIVVPDFIPTELWEGFLEMRRDRKYPCTPHALELAIESIQKLKTDGHDPVGCLKQTTERGYRGIFPVSGGSNHKYPEASKNSQTALNMIEELRKKKLQEVVNETQS